MENANVIAFERYTFKTGKALEEYDKWNKASMNPMMMSTGFRLGQDRSFPLEDKLSWISIQYYKDLQDYCSFVRSVERKAYEKDFKITWAGNIERSWRSLYLTVQRFNLLQRDPLDKGKIVDKNTYLKEFTEENAPVALIRGLRLSQGEWEKYDNWMNEWGYDIYLPMLLKFPRIIEYCRCWLTNLDRRDSGSLCRPTHLIDQEFPEDVSIIYFENMRAYQNFLKSKELEAYNRTIASAFPGGLIYEWDIACSVNLRWSR